MIPSSFTLPLSKPSVSEQKEAKKFEPIIEENGITIFKRSRTHSPYNEVLGQIVLKSDMFAALAYFMDPKNYKEWVYSCLKSDLVEMKDPTHFSTYLQMDLPWPFQDRDLISQVRFFQDEAQSKVVGYLNLTQGGPSKPHDMVRVENWESVWLLELISNTEFKLSIRMWAEPGGNLLPSITNMILGRIELWTMQNLTQKLQEQKGSYTLPRWNLPLIPNEIAEKLH